MPKASAPNQRRTAWKPRRPPPQQPSGAKTSSDITTAVLDSKRQRRSRRRSRSRSSLGRHSDRTRFSTRADLLIDERLRRNPTGDVRAVTDPVRKHTSIERRPCGSRIITIGERVSPIHSTNSVHIRGRKVTHVGRPACITGSHQCNSTTTGQRPIHLLTPTPGTHIIGQHQNPGAGALDGSDNILQLHIPCVISNLHIDDRGVRGHRLDQRGKKRSMPEPVNTSSGNHTRTTHNIVGSVRRVACLHTGINKSDAGSRPRGRIVQGRGRRDSSKNEHGAGCHRCAESDRPHGTHHHHQTFHTSTRHRTGTDISPERCGQVVHQQPH